MRIEGPLRLRPQETPATDGFWHLYMKSNGRVYTLSPEGEETDVAASGLELIDSPVPPVEGPMTYLRFERDENGDVQAIYLGTAD